MTTEEKIKNLILNRFHSIREFSIVTDIPYTTLDSILKRGIGNSSVSNVIKICKALGISADALAEGEIVLKAHQKPMGQNVSNPVEVGDILSDTKNILLNSNLTLNGEPIDKSGVESIIDAIDVGVEIVNRKNTKKP